MAFMHRTEHSIIVDSLLEQKLDVEPLQSHSNGHPSAPIPLQLKLKGGLSSLQLLGDDATKPTQLLFPEEVNKGERTVIQVPVGRQRCPSRTEQKVSEHKTIVVSNRLPLKLSNQGGEISSVPSTGGLATGMKSVHESGNGLWIGWSGIAAEELDVTAAKAVEEVLEEQSCAGVSLNQEEVDKFYLGFSNNALWPLFHYFLEYARYGEAEWEVYKRVNQKFADVVCSNLEDGDTVWVHDYQLLLLPELIRARCPNVTIGFFLHIPFPSWEVLRTFPWRKIIIQGILGADLVGFHTKDYVRNFTDSARNVLGVRINHDEIFHRGRAIDVSSFPMGIDYDRFLNAALRHEKQEASDQSELQKKLNLFLETTPDAKIILSIDRMDYTKGIPQRLEAYELFLEQHPEYHGKVHLVMLAVPSRSEVQKYRQLKCEVDELVGRINGKYSTISWNPIWYYYRSLPFENLIDLYTSSHIALVTPVRDGMNLVAKEYVATRTKRDGVLILSEMAGAACELKEAIQVNPYSKSELAGAMYEALELPQAEQVARMTQLQQRVKTHSVSKWAMEFMDSLEHSPMTSATL